MIFFTSSMWFVEQQEKQKSPPPRIFLETFWFRHGFNWISRECEETYEFCKAAGTLERLLDICASSLLSHPTATSSSMFKSHWSMKPMSPPCPQNGVGWVLRSVNLTPWTAWLFLYGILSIKRPRKGQDWWPGCHPNCPGDQTAWAFCHTPDLSGEIFTIYTINLTNFNNVPFYLTRTFLFYFYHYPI